MPVFLKEAAGDLAFDWGAIDASAPLRTTLDEVAKAAERKNVMEQAVKEKNRAFAFNVAKAEADDAFKVQAFNEQVAAREAGDIHRATVLENQATLASNTSIYQNKALENRRIADAAAVDAAIEKQDFLETEMWTKDIRESQKIEQKIKENKQVEDRLIKADSLKYNIDAGVTEAGIAYESGIYDGIPIKGKDKTMLTKLNKSLTEAQSSRDDKAIAFNTELIKLIKADVKGGKQVTDLDLILTSMDSSIPAEAEAAEQAFNRFETKNKDLLKGYDKAQKNDSITKIEKEVIAALGEEKGFWNTAGNLRNVLGSAVTSGANRIGGKDTTLNVTDTTLATIETAIASLGISAADEKLKVKLERLRRRAYKLNPYEKGTRAYKKKRAEEVTNLVKSRAKRSDLAGI